MKIFITVLALATIAQAQYNRYNPQVYHSNGGNWAILRQAQDSSPDGSYAYSYDTENGISVKEQGQPKLLAAGVPAQVVTGEYSYPAPDGRQIVVRYYADETGFHATGDHLPVPPPIPVAIQKSLAYNAANPLPQNPYNRRY
ncbi:endocuticle structural glycoprotein SgAbd-1-like [Athalia rosae]|uniref:endocuticle structural glycoprotein SgAbd-1-like n=1 Tax=Athalia rosae TaxID=37344 RepID=UPI002033DF5C|nr:endocuticle structural glycoprotein SgAbd-1-like [Athalia rosae]